MSTHTIFDVGDNVHAEHPITLRKRALATITFIDEEDGEEWPFLSLRFLDGSTKVVSTGYATPCNDYCGCED